jgi:hypothetical protein
MYVQICKNGMMGWRRETGSKTRFSLNWHTVSAERINAYIAHFEGMQAHYVELASNLNSIKLSSKQVKARIEKLVPGEGKRASGIREQIAELYVSGKGNRGETAWDLFNAVTEYENHHKRYKETSVAALENRRKGILSIDMDDLAKLVG